VGKKARGKKIRHPGDGFTPSPSDRHINFSVIRIISTLKSSFSPVFLSHISGRSPPSRYIYRGSGHNLGILSSLSVDWPLVNVITSYAPLLDSINLAWQLLTDCMSVFFM
jgi:hypothetical protein